jgi:hypothetical protein
MAAAAIATAAATASSVLLHRRSSHVLDEDITIRRGRLWQR